jgi:hypothetical protein
VLDTPFTTREALRAGLTPAQLRAARWHSPFRGVHQPASQAPTLEASCRALALLLPPAAVFSGITAARLAGWWMPQGAESLPLHVTVPPDRLVVRAGVRATRRSLPASDVTEYRGLRVTTGSRTLRDLAADWSLIDLVVMADAALRCGDCTRRQLLNTAAACGGRGIRTFRGAVKLADPRSESAMETLLRLIVVIPGLPEPTPQFVIRDSAGGWLARVDLLGANGSSVLEYDGAAHDAPKRHASDVARWRLLRREGYEVFPYTARDVFFGPAQIISDYQAALGLPLDQSAAQRWLHEWSQSSFRRHRAMP